MDYAAAAAIDILGKQIAALTIRVTELEDALGIWEHPNDSLADTVNGLVEYSTKTPTREELAVEREQDEQSIANIQKQLAQDRDRADFLKSVADYQVSWALYLAANGKAATQEMWRRVSDQPLPGWLE